jgi:hypothetical protein
MAEKKIGVREMKTSAKFEAAEMEFLRGDKERRV